MSIAPVGRLKKAEIVWLSKHRCRHNHTYLEHYSCYQKENPLKGKIGFFDIEASNLAANFGIMLCYCIKEANKNKIHYAHVSRKELLNNPSEEMDKTVVKSCIDDLTKFDRIVTFYGKRFDMPFVRTRASSLKLDFPGYGELCHDDVYYTVRNKYRLHSNRQENACRAILGKTRKTHFDGHIWIRATQGDETSIQWILEHCKADVRDLEDLYNAVNFSTRKTDTSI